MGERRTKSETTKVLENLYMENDQGLGKAILSLYKFVRQNYLNITRKEVTDFLRKQGNYSVTRPYNKTKYNKPVLAQSPNERIGMDTIKMARYSNYATASGADSQYRKNMEYANDSGKYTQILTMIDYFSKKVVNDVIKLEVSTGVGIFFWKVLCSWSEK